MDTYIQVDCRVSSKEQSDILIAELTEIGFDGFEENENLLSAFIAESLFDETILKQILESSGITYSKKIIPPINWNEKWESEFSPVVVDDFVAVRAFFHQPIQGVQHEIIITPKMSFGTGHHATTCLMICQM